MNASKPLNLPSIPLILGVAVIMMAIIGAFSSYFTVPTESVGVVLRFGKFIRTADPGLHLKVPFGVETVDIVPTQRQLKLEFGYATPGATNEYQFSNETDFERLMVTGDLNSALVEWVVQFRIEDPFQYLFRIRDPALTLRALSESIMREVVGDRTVDEVLTFGRQEMESEVLTKLQAAAKKYELGTFIDQVQLKNVNPPQPVQTSFDEVNRAQQEREQAINVARREYNRVIPLARGEAEQQLSQAEGYAIQRVNEAKGDVARFSALLEQYQIAPAVTRTRIYLETMTDVVGAMDRKIVIDENASGILPLLQLPTGQPTTTTTTPPKP